MVNVPSPAVFRCKNRVFIPLMLFAVFINIAYLCFVITQQGRLLAGLAILLIGFVIFALLEYLFIIQKSDILIDEQGISRTLFGRTWRTIRWVDLAEVSSFLVPRVSRVPRRVYRLYKSIDPRFIRPGTIVFTDEMNNVSALLELVNHYISRYDLKVKIRVDGQEVSASTLT